MTVHLIHGIRQFKPEAHMQPLAHALQRKGVPYNHVSYGPIWIPVTNQKAVNAVLEDVKDGDDVVAYSNGAWAIHQAMELGLKLNNLYVISGALNVNAEFPNVDQVTVYFSERDLPTLAAKWYSKITRVLPWRWRDPHGWGAMGRFGYEGRDPKVLNVNMGTGVGHGWYDHENVVEMIAQDVYNGRPVEFLQK